MYFNCSQRSFLGYAFCFLDLLLFLFTSATVVLMPFVAFGSCLVWLISVHSMTVACELCRSIGNFLLSAMNIPCIPSCEAHKLWVWRLCRTVIIIPLCHHPLFVFLSFSIHTLSVPSSLSPFVHLSLHFLTFLSKCLYISFILIFLTGFVLLLEVLEKPWNLILDFKGA